MVQIFGENSGARRRRNIRGFMAIVTTGGCVLAGERKAGFAMVECFAVGLPADQRKVGAVVLGVARSAVFARRIRGNPHRVHAAPLGDSLANLNVAIEALKLYFAAAKRVALRAVERARKRFVRLR